MVGCTGQPRQIILFYWFKTLNKKENISLEHIMFQPKIHVAVCPVLSLNISLLEHTLFLLLRVSVLHTKAEMVAKGGGVSLVFH